MNSLILLSQITNQPTNQPTDRPTDQPTKEITKGGDLRYPQVDVTWAV